jgi:cytochrome c oxidase subunit 2
MMDWTKWLALPPLASAHGKDVDRMMLFIHLMMVVLFVGWFIYFVYVLWRFNQKRQPKADSTGARSHFSSYVEGTVAAVEIALLLGFAIPMWVKLNETRNLPKPEESTLVRITGEQFQWYFTYPGNDGKYGRQNIALVSASNPLGYDPDDENGKDDFTVVKEMHVPVGKPVLLRVTSKDVIHSFKVAALRFTLDAVPGVANTSTFTPTRPGRYMITCAQLCGVGHARMAGILYVDTPEQYAKWLAEKQAEKNKPTTPAPAPSPAPAT